MIVCYADGDGLGHLTRLRAALHTLGRTGPVTILSGSRFATDPRVVGDWPLRCAPAGLDRAGLTRWIGTLLAELAPDEFVVDAFPCGLKGELMGAVVPDPTRVTHLARLLRWEVYRELIPADPPRLDRTFVLEPLAPAHEAYLRSISEEVVPLGLDEPPASPAAEVPDGWLVVHSGPDSELLDLVAYARDMASFEGIRPSLTLVSPRRPQGLANDIVHLDVYPAWPLFPSAERIVTAAGFNAVRQLAPWRDKHRMLPFPRRLDDQFTRAARARSWPGQPEPSLGAGLFDRDAQRPVRAGIDEAAFDGVAVERARDEHAEVAVGGLHRVLERRGFDEPE